MITHLGRHADSVEYIFINCVLFLLSLSLTASHEINCCVIVMSFLFNCVIVCHICNAVVLSV